MSPTAPPKSRFRRRRATSGGTVAPTPCIMYGKWRLGVFCPRTSKIGQSIKLNILIILYNIHQYIIYYNYINRLYNTVICHNITISKYIVVLLATPCPLLEICRPLAIQNIWRKTPYHLYGRGRKPPNMAVPHIQSTCGPPPGPAERGRL